VALGAGGNAPTTPRFFMREFCPGVLRAIVLAGAVALPGLRAVALEPDCGLEATALYEKVAESVVQVQSISVNPFLVRSRMRPNLGTGFVVGEGDVLTNYHVVSEAEEVVIFSDTRAIPADVIGIDPTLDVALLRPLEEGIVARPLEFAAPSAIAIGQDVYAVGYPLGIGKSISAGIVSGMSRVLPRTTSSWLSPYIQTDAAVSPGNSGGPLIDECGRVVGLITGKINAPAAENLAFAIPTEVLVPVVAELGTKGRVSRPWHGLYGQMVTPPILMMLGAPPWEAREFTGFLVETVEPGSAADRAGLRGGVWPVRWGPTEILLGGDIITEVNGVRIDTLETALGIVRGLKIGERVKLRALRDGTELEVSVMLEERPLIEREMELYRYPTAPE
jgi:putative serine protease PepD